MLVIAAGCNSLQGIDDILVVSQVEVAPATSSVRVGGTIQLTATPKTASGIVVVGRTVVWSSSNPEIATVSATGLVQAVAVGGPVRLTAQVSDVTGEALVTVLATPVARVTVAPSQADLPLGTSTQLSAAAYNAANQVMPGVTFTWQSSNPAIADVTTTGIVLAIAEGGPVTISATADGVSGSTSITVFKPAPIAPLPAKLAFIQEPGPATAGQPLTPAVRVAVQDDQGATVSSSSARVTMSLANSSGGANLTGTLTADAVNGVATFSDLVIDRAGTGYTLAASAPGLAAATSAPFNVAAPAPPSLTITVQPSSSAQTGVVFPQQPVIELRTGSGQPVSGVAVTAAIESGSGSLNGGTTVVSDANGLATYSNLSISGAQGTHTLRFDASGFPSASSNPIVVSAGPASQLSFTQQPGSSATSGQGFAQQPILVLRDASNNPVSGQVVTATVTGSPTGVSLIGTTSVTTDASGTASFVGTGLGLSGPSGTYTLTFQSGTVTSPASAPISLKGGSPARVTYTQQPGSTAQSGQPFSQQPILLVQDAGNNPVGGQVVTASITGSPAGASLVGTTTATTDSAGVATFVGSGLGISGPVGSYTLTFQAGPVSSASNSIALSAGPPAQLTITVQPGSVAARNVAFLPQPVIQLHDGAGNAVNQAGVPVTAAIASGPSNASLGGTTTIPTDSSGTASFTNLKINRSGTYTLIFQSGTLQPVISNPITIP